MAIQSMLFFLIKVDDVFSKDNLWDFEFSFSNFQYSGVDMGFNKITWDWL